MDMGMEMMLGHNEDEKRRETLTVDLPAEQISKLKVGQQIELLVKGSVGMLQVPPNGESSDRSSSVGIRVTSKTVKGLNTFEQLAATDDEEMDTSENDSEVVR